MTVDDFSSMASSSSTAEIITPPEERTASFRVIIAGGGVAGLAISHALTRVGIDHVVFEKGVVAPPWGASISLWGNGARILDQIGCLDAIEAAAIPLKDLHIRGADGKSFDGGPFFDMMLERNGFNCITMERRAFLEIVYNQHPDKSKIITGKRVVDVVHSDEGVEVVLNDGTIEKGDVLIGCDGVHSVVRELMWREANTEAPHKISTSEKRSLVTTYRSLVGVSKAIPGLGIRDMHWVCHRNLSFLILTQPDQIYWFVNFKLPQKTRWPTKSKWSNDEAEAAAASVIELPISDSAVFGELWKNRIRAHLIGLEEGIFEHWHHGRIALVGDSVHKVTPNFALGAMCALESSSTLLNEIISMHSALSPGTRPTHSEITAMFHRYQEGRKPRMQEEASASALLTRLQAFDGPLNHFIMRYAFPVYGCKFVADKLGRLCSTAPKIEALPVRYRHPASIPWKDELSSPMRVNYGSNDRFRQWSGDGVIEVAFHLVLITFLLAIC